MAFRVVLLALAVVLLCAVGAIRPPRGPQVPAPPSSPPGWPDQPASYRDCGDVRADENGPLRTGDPGYRAGLDQDGDGVACNE